MNALSAYTGNMMSGGQQTQQNVVNAVKRGLSREVTKRAVMYMARKHEGGAAALLANGDKVSGYLQSVAIGGTVGEFIGDGAFSMLSGAVADIAATLDGALCGFQEAVKEQALLEADAPK